MNVCIYVYVCMYRICQVVVIANHFYIPGVAVVVADLLHMGLTRTGRRRVLVLIRDDGGDPEALHGMHPSFIPKGFSHGQSSCRTHARQDAFGVLRSGLMKHDVLLPTRHECVHQSNQRGLHVLRPGGFKQRQVARGRDLNQLLLLFVTQ
jgi:hypothetical protein